MAHRNMDIKIITNPYSSLHVYSDLTVEQVNQIEGVIRAYELGGFISIDLDPRYDPESVKNDIRALAEPKPLRCTLGTVGVWTPVDTALPLSGVKVIVRGDFDAYWQCDYYVAERKFCFRGPNGARIEWLNDSMVINNVTHWSPIPPNE